MIKAISITNFKGIGDPGIRIDLEPVTLLFGNNSAGKSTIFHAFLYAYEVIVNRNLNADRTALGGENVDLGGFLKFVHDHDSTNKVTIEIELDLASAQLDKEWRIPEFLVGTKENEVDLSTLGTDAWSSKISVTVAWDVGTTKPFVSGFTVDIDNERLLSIWADKDEEEINAKVNYRHPVFQWPTATTPSEQGSAGVLDSLYPAFQTVSDQWFWNQATEVTDDVLELPDEAPDDHDGQPSVVFGVLPASGSDLSDYRMIEDADNASFVRYFYRYDRIVKKANLVGAVYHLGPEWSASEAKSDWNKKLSISEQDLFRPIQILEQEDSLPPLDRPLQLLIAPDIETETRELIRAVVSRLALGPVRLLARELSNFRHIGPLRSVLPRAFQTSLSPDASRWCSGLAAWDTLSVASDEFVEQVSNWLSRADRLGTGYSLIRKRFKELDVDGYILRMLKQENPLDDLQIALDEIESLPTMQRLSFRDEESQVMIEPPDIAVGITQLLPVVVAAVDKHPGVTLIEQPELHNHPAVEVGLGDLFVETIHQTHCRFILETHGEHLMLRMLRRIRETTEGTLPTGTKGLLPDELAVYYIERNADGVVAKRLHIDESGEFIDKWPKGFFRERAEELF
jgi:hypothetical protein